MKIAEFVCNTYANALAARISVRMYISQVYPNIATCSKPTVETSHGRAKFAVRRKIGEFHGCMKPTYPNNPFLSVVFVFRQLEKCATFYGKF